MQGNVSVGLSGSDYSYSWNDVDVDWQGGQTFEARSVRGETAGAAAPDATLQSLAVSDAQLSPAFDAETLLYTATVDSGTASVTLSAAANDDDAGVAFGPSEDADRDEAGHQAAVPYGKTVTATDGSTQRTYRVVAKRPALQRLRCRSGRRPTRRSRAGIRRRWSCSSVPIRGRA